MVLLVLLVCTKRLNTIVLDKDCEAFIDWCFIVWWLEWFLDEL